MSPFVGGAFGSGLRPQYQLFLAVLAARELERSVRVVLTRQQMLPSRPPAGDDPAHRARRDRGRHARRDHPRARRRTRRTFEDFTPETIVDWSGLLYRCANVELVTRSCSSTSHTPCDMRAPGAASARVRARVRDGRARRRSRHRSARAAAAELRRARPERGQAVLQQGAARMLSAGRRAFGWCAAQPGAALDARGRRARRLGHGDRRLGSDADAGRAAPRCRAQRQA